MVCIGPAKQLQYREKRAAPGLGNAQQNCPEPLQPRFQRQHELILHKTGAAVEAIPVRDSVQRVKEGIEMTQARVLPPPDTLLIMQRAEEARRNPPPSASVTSDYFVPL